MIEKKNVKFIKLEAPFFFSKSGYFYHTKYNLVIKYVRPRSQIGNHHPLGDMALELNLENMASDFHQSGKWKQDEISKLQARFNQHLLLLKLLQYNQFSCQIRQFQSLNSNNVKTLSHKQAYYHRNELQILWQVKTLCYLVINYQLRGRGEHNEKKKQRIWL